MTAGNSHVVTRFAPSPNGELHLGHALSAMVGYDWARRHGGRFLVRIEDIDQQRSREAFIQSIGDDLNWLGLSWERPELRQSQHFADYGAAARRLQEMGLLYPCFATRGEIAAEVARRTATGGAETLDPDGVPLYPGLHRNLSLEEVRDRQAFGEPFALRLDVARAVVAARARLDGGPLTFREVDAAGGVRVIEARPERWGDAVLIRKDTPASYHLAVVVDDARQGITHVTRGRDLFAATDMHRLLQVLLDLPEPLYHHHALLLDAQGRKLSKSEGAPTLRALRGSGVTAEAVRVRIAEALATVQ